MKSYVQEIALAVLDCKETAASREQFVEHMAARGYRVDWQDNRKYITFTNLEREAVGKRLCKIKNTRLRPILQHRLGKRRTGTLFCREFAQEKQEGWLKQPSVFDMQKL